MPKVDPATQDTATLAREAQAMLFKNPKQFLEKYALQLGNTNFQPGDAAHPNVGTFVMTIKSDDGVHPVVQMGPDGKQSAVRATIEPPGGGTTPLDLRTPNQFEIEAFHIPVQAACQPGGFDTVRLPSGEGPAVVFTTQITACTLTLIPGPDKSYSAAHLQPMNEAAIDVFNTKHATTVGHDRAKNGHELHEAVSARATPGQVVLGKSDTEHTTANIVGVRSAGEWKFYAQHVNQSNIVSVSELKPLVQASRLNPVQPDIDARAHIDAALAGPARLDVDLLEPHRTNGRISELREGEVVRGKVLAAQAFPGLTYVRDDSKPRVPENDRPVKTFDTPTRHQHARGQEVHVSMDRNNRRQDLLPSITIAPAALEMIHKINPHIPGVLQPPAAPKQGLLHR